MAAPSDTPSTRLSPPAIAHQLHRLMREAAEPAWLLGEVGRRMAERLSWIRTQPDQALVWWPELGGGEQALRSQYPNITLHTQATPGAPPAAPPTWWRSLARPFKPRGSQPFDMQQSSPMGLVWANMMLHWADADLPTLLATWHRALATEGFLMFSAFGPDTVRGLNAVHEAMGWGPAGPAFIDMHDLGDQLVHTGFADPVMDMEMITLSWPDLPALLRELRCLGGNTAAQRFIGLRTPRWQQRWQAALEQQLRGPDGRLSLRFEIIYGHAFKPLPRPAVKAETTVSLDDMRSLVRRGPTGNPR